MREGRDRRLAHWGDVIAEAYASGARPPLPKKMIEELSQKLADALATADRDGVRDSAWPDCVNSLLDEWEIATGLVGARLLTIGPSEDTVGMVERSQADHPLRPFGGQ